MGWGVGGCDNARRLTEEHRNVWAASHRRRDYGCHVGAGVIDGQKPDRQIHRRARRADCEHRVCAVRPGMVWREKRSDLRGGVLRPRGQPAFCKLQDGGVVGGVLDGGSDHVSQGEVGRIPLAGTSAGEAGDFADSANDAAAAGGVGDGGVDSAAVGEWGVGGETWGGGGGNDEIRNSKFESMTRVRMTNGNSPQKSAALRLCFTPKSEWMFCFVNFVNFRHDEGCNRRGCGLL